MSWVGLAADIATQFDCLTGCSDPILRQGFGMTIHRSLPGGAMKGRRAPKQGRNELSRIRRREKDRMARLSKYETPARMILTGRGLEGDNWIEIFTNPVSAVELEAFADFCFWLNHRRVQRKQIASLLQTNLAEVNAALAGRGQ